MPKAKMTVFSALKTNAAGTKASVSPSLRLCMVRNAEKITKINPKKREERK
ncbi:MAG: hypothetical protein KBG20_14040 [Caldilineaceae bacterium]|nr:hypothetical protein [Caldilineaceae bacterium]MBP8106750.1 hypothetical protein [Caldilineaceae bacterium]MBP8123379.1 hypothetical protein [Caldilineaceae bacterium]MBP9073422.1 hypothetical protein [Caldilineaceae bacterium]